jgi:hypothetical protein
MHPRLVIGISIVSALFGAEPSPEFMTLDSAQPVLKAMSGQLPEGLRTGTLDAARWNAWLHKEDSQVRGRLDAGEEDTISNLLRFGVTFTKEYRIDDEYFARYGESSLVNSFAEHRAGDLIVALGSGKASQGFVEMRAFLEKKGFSLATAAERAKLRRHLLDNLSRMHREFLQARQQAQTNRSRMFQQRGISLDSNLWPDYDLDLQLRRMAADGSLKPGSVRRIAIVGPGLDFVNKQEGVDYYPPQTTQPFAVLDSLLRQELAHAEIEIYTLDISPRVNLHIAAARKQAVIGKPYTVQLPWYAGGRWSDAFRAQFVAYWQALGSRIGEPVAAIPVPDALAGIETRAVRVRPEMVERIRPIDMNIVYQYLPVPRAGRFDVVIGTNIFLYYGAFEQSLAMRNVAAMLKPGGYLLSNDKLPDWAGSGFGPAAVTSIPMTSEPVIADFLYTYKRTS